MRTLGFLLLAACSSNGGGGGGDDDTGIDAPTGPVEPCDRPVADYCSQVQCDTSPAAARNDAMLCPANEISCLDIDLVVSTMADAGVNLYYQGDTLIAIEDITIVGPHCVAGPAMFAPPSCGTDMG